MPYISSGERLGEARGAVQALRRLLQQRFGDEPGEVVALGRDGCGNPGRLPGQGAGRSIVGRRLSRRPATSLTLQAGYQKGRRRGRRGAGTRPSSGIDTGGLLDLRSACSATLGVRCASDLWDRVQGTDRRNPMCNDHDHPWKGIQGAYPSRPGRVIRQRRMTPKAPSASGAETQCPCDNCGAGREFTPGTDALVCPYCGHSNPIPVSVATFAPEGLDFHAARTGATARLPTLARTTVAVPTDKVIERAPSSICTLSG